MKVKSLYAENILSFETFDLKLDGTNLTVVGPNGAGKSNIVRLFSLIETGIYAALESFNNNVSQRPYTQILSSFAQATHRGKSPESPTIVKLEFELSTLDEKDHLGTFIRAGILCTLFEELQSKIPLVNYEGILSDWVQENIVNEKLSPLSNGTIVMRHIGMSHINWEISFEFIYGDLTYSWPLRNDGYILGVDEIPNSSDANDRGTIPITKCLFDIDPYAGTVSLPSNLPEFDFSLLCPKQGTKTTPMVIRTGTGSYNSKLQPFRRAAEVLNIPADNVAGQSVFPLAQVMAILLHNGIITLGEQFRGLGIGGSPALQAHLYDWAALVSPLRNRNPATLPLRLFTLKNGTPDQQSKFKEIQDKFSELAQTRSFDVTFRATNLQELNPMPIGAGQLSIFTGHNNIVDSSGISALNAGQAQSINQPQTDIQTSLPVTQGALITIVVAQEYSIGGGRDNNPNYLPIELHGAGTWEALVISEALIEARDNFLILDEPAITLHPTRQRTIRSHIKNSLGSSLVVTHSANLVPIHDENDLRSLIRVANESGSTEIHRFPENSLVEIDKVIKEFSLSTDAVSLLFAGAVVLVEGETELGAFPKWFRIQTDDKGENKPADLDLAFYSVGGHNNFRTVLSFMHAFNIPCVLICDGAVLDIARFKNKNNIFNQALKAGITSCDLDNFKQKYEGKTMNEGIFNELVEIAKNIGIFTLANGWKTGEKKINEGEESYDENFETFLNRVAPGKLDEAEKEMGGSKVRCGLWIAEHVECPDEISFLYEQITKALQKQGLFKLS